jgi:hypothetical protein
VHGAHTIGRSGFCASYRSRRGVCRGYGTFGAKEKHIFAKGRRRDSVGGRERGRERVSDRGTRGQRLGGWEARRRAATEVSAVPRASARARPGSHGRDSAARRGSSARRGGTRPAGNGHVRHLGGFPGKMPRFERPRVGGAETYLAAWTRRVAWRAPRRTRHAPPSRPLGSGAGASPWAPPARRVEC